MKKIVSAMVLTLAWAAPVLAQSNSPGTSPPSTQNSGAGISGQPGNKNGPGVRSGTVGAGTATGQQNSTATQQDAAKVKGMPGNKSGPAAKQPSR